MSAITARLRLISVDWLQLLMLLLTLGGLGVSGYLMWGYTTPGASLACGSSHGCDTVKDSVYSSFMGIPLPIIGLISYLTLFVLIIAQNQATIRGRGWSSYISLAIFGFSLTGVLYSVYLTYLELFVIYAICRWCVASAIIMVVIFLLSIFNLRKNNQSYYVEG
jgi:uncharacterized membrane protein